MIDETLTSSVSTKNHTSKILNPKSEFRNSAAAAETQTAQQGTRHSTFYCSLNWASRLSVAVRLTLFDRGLEYKPRFLFFPAPAIYAMRMYLHTAQSMLSLIKNPLFSNTFYSGTDPEQRSMKMRARRVGWCAEASVSSRVSHDGIRTPYRYSRNHVR